MFGHQTKLWASAFIKVIPGWVSCNSFMTCSCLSGGTSNPTAPQNASILNTCSSSFLLKKWQQLCSSCTKPVGHEKTMSNLGHHWVSASSLLYLPGINGSFISSFCEVHNVFRDGCVFWCISQRHPIKAIYVAIFLAGFVFNSVVICLKHYGPTEDKGRGSFREGFVFTKQTQ